MCQKLCIIMHHQLLIVSNKCELMVCFVSIFVAIHWHCFVTSSQEDRLPTDNKYMSTREKQRGTRQ